MRSREREDGRRGRGGMEKEKGGRKNWENNRTQEMGRKRKKEGYRGRKMGEKVNGGGRREEEGRAEWKERKRRCSER